MDIINIKPTTTEEYEYEAALNGAMAYFNDTSSFYNHLVMFEVDNHKIRMSLNGATPKSTVIENNVIKYLNAFNDVDIVYTLSEDKLKEDIIIRSAAAPHSFSFNTTEMDVIASFKEDGSVEYLDISNETIFKIEAPYAYDSNGYEIDVAVSYDGKSYTYELLDYEGAAYPITLDPTITMGGSETFYSYMPGHKLFVKYKYLSPSAYEIYDYDTMTLQRSHSTTSVTSALSSSYNFMNQRLFALKKNLLIGSRYTTTANSYYTGCSIQWRLLKENGTVVTINELATTLDMIPFYADDTKIMWLGMSALRIASKTFYWKPSIITTTIDAAGVITGVSIVSRSFEDSSLAATSIAIPSILKMTKITSSEAYGYWYNGAYYMAIGVEHETNLFSNAYQVQINTVYFEKHSDRFIVRVSQTGASDKLTWYINGNLDVSVNIPKVNGRKIVNSFAQYENDNFYIVGQEQDASGNCFGVHRFLVDPVAKTITFDKSIKTNTSAYVNSPTRPSSDTNLMGYYVGNNGFELVRLYVEPSAISAFILFGMTENIQADAYDILQLNEFAEQEKISGHETLSVTQLIQSEGQDTIQLSSSVLASSGEALPLLTSIQAIDSETFALVSTIQAIGDGSLNITETSLNSSVDTLPIFVSIIDSDSLSLSLNELIQGQDSNIIQIDESISSGSCDELMLLEKVFIAAADQLALTQNIYTESAAVINLINRVQQSGYDALSLLEMIKDSGYEVMAINESISGTYQMTLNLKEQVTLPAGDVLQLFDYVILTGQEVMALNELVMLSGRGKLIIKDRAVIYCGNKNPQDYVNIVEHILAEGIRLIETVSTEPDKTVRLSPRSAVRMKGRRYS